MIAEGFLTCSVSAPFTSAAALFFLYQGFVERSVRVSVRVIEDVGSLCVRAVSQSSLNRSEV